MSPVSGMATAPPYRWWRQESSTKEEGHVEKRTAGKKGGAGRSSWSCPKAAAGGKGRIRRKGARETERSESERAERNKVFSKRSCPRQGARGPSPRWHSDWQ